MADSRLLIIILVALAISLGNSKQVFKRSQADDLFNEADENGDGFVTAPELQTFLGGGVPLRVCKSIIASVDEDGDQKMNEQEFNKKFAPATKAPN